MRNNCQIPGLFTDFKMRYKKNKDYNFLLHWFTGLVYANVIIHLSVGEKTSLFTSTSVNNCSLGTDTEGNNNCFSIC